MNCSDPSAEGNDIHRPLLVRSMQICPSLNNHDEHFTQVNTNRHIKRGLFVHESVILE
jgi:hypothetical protein